MKFNFSISKGLDDLIKKLMHGLGKLTFEDNMESFKVVDLEIPAGQVITISNKLTFVPSKYIIVSQEGNGLVTKDVSPDTGKGWDNKFVFLKNNGSFTVKITVIFMR